ncbi:MAG: hypothetical protein AAF721_39125 [Myxococcota bacterium]
MTDPGKPHRRGTSRIADNPFYVLELSPQCAAVEVERQGSKLLAMLELGLVDAESYDTPFGVRERTADAVRTAMAQLRDPDQRIVHELWAAMDPTAPIDYVGAGNEAASGNDGARGLPNAMRLFGWGSRR